MIDFEWDIPPKGHDHNRKDLFESVAWASENLERVLPQYSIVWENPKGGPVAITTPSPEWLAMAIHGGLLPDIEVHHRLRAEWTNDAGEVIQTRANETPGPGWKGGKIVNGWLLHAGPRAPAMTQEEAIEYILQKDVPLLVWYDHETSNRRRFVICKKDQIPTNRKLRNAWSLIQPGA